MAMSRQLVRFRKDKLKSISLLDIVKIFNTAINEEQAWAICHQSCQSFKLGIKERQHADICKNGIDAIRFYADGTIHIGLQTPSDSNDKDGEASANSEKNVNCEDVAGEKLLASLGLAIFQALDYGLSGGEERHLSDDLEGVIDLMTDCERDTDDDGHDDEGIEEDQEDGVRTHSCTSDSVIQICKEHLCHVHDVADHYQAVCRALVAEVSELITFLENISEAEKEGENSEAGDLLEQYCANWAKVWVQVVRELRRSVKLKKVERLHINLPPLEYEMTPYEMLMDDIRTRRYTLKKIMIDGDIPAREKYEGHDVILEFIRSRPPLKSARDRVLRTPPVVRKTPMEKLLDDIRSVPKLKPACEGRARRFESRMQTFDDDDSDRVDCVVELPAPVRKIIKPDMALLKLLESSDEDMSEDDSNGDNEICPRDNKHTCLHTPDPGSPIAPASPHLSSPRRGSSPDCQLYTSTPRSWQRAVMADLVLGVAPNKLRRRHSITVCESPSFKVERVRRSHRHARMKFPHRSDCIPEIDAENERDVVVFSDFTNAAHCSQCYDKRIHAVNDRSDACDGCKSHLDLSTVSHGDVGYESKQDFSYRHVDSARHVHDCLMQNGMTTETRGVHGTKQGVHSMTQRVHGTTQGVHGTTQGVHGVTQGVHGTTYGVYSVTHGVHSMIQGVHGMTQGVHGTTHGVHDMTQGVHDVKQPAIGGVTQNHHYKTHINEVKHNPPPMPCVNNNNNNNNNIMRTSCHTTLDTMKDNSVWNHSDISQSHSLPDSSVGSSSDILHSQWKNPMECLSLNLEEIMHIRTVLTKAELDALHMKPALYSLVAKEKVCFTCKDTRFTFFGEWGTRCRFCKRTACSKCIRKLNVPSDKFGAIPVYTLTPERRVNKDEEAFITKYAGTGSKPPSPVSPRRASASPTSHSLPLNQPSPFRRSHTISSRPSSTFNFRRPDMSVCRDCKDLICEIIRVSRVAMTITNRGGDSTASLTNHDSTSEQKKTRFDLQLDLKPV